MSVFRPTRHTDLKIAPIAIGAAILAAIQAQGSLSFSSMESIVRASCGEVSHRTVQEVLLYLYTLGALDFSDDLDAFVAAAIEGARP